MAGYRTWLLNPQSDLWPPRGPVRAATNFAPDHVQVVEMWGSFGCPHLVCPTPRRPVVEISLLNESQAAIGDSRMGQAIPGNEAGLFSGGWSLRGTAIDPASKSILSDFLYGFADQNREACQTERDCRGEECLVLPLRPTRVLP